MDVQRAYHLLEKSIEEIKEQGHFQDDKKFNEFIKQKLDMTDNEFRDLYYHTDERIEKLWNEISDDLFEEQEDKSVKLRQDWNGFAKGTDKEVLYDWFDWHHSKNISWLKEHNS